MNDLSPTIPVNPDNIKVGDIVSQVVYIWDFINNRKRPIKLKYERVSFISNKYGYVHTDLIGYPGTAYGGAILTYKLEKRNIEVDKNVLKNYAIINELT